ncbi:MAG: nuclear transport factor 2 family protein [Spartobacteria bacterium]
MKKLLSLTMIALLATIAVSIAAPDNDAMMGKEKAAWQAFKDKNADGFKKVVDHDIVGVYADGVADMAKEMADMQKWDMKSFAISDYKSHSDEKDVVVSTYKVTLEGTFDGKDGSGVYNAGTVWKQENGKWLAIFHTNVKQASGEMTPDAQKKE